MTRVPITLAAVVLALAASAGAAEEAGAPAPAETAGAGSPAPESVPALIERMARDDFSGLDASRKLAAMGAPAVPELVRAVEHDVPRVRYWSIAALSGIGSDSALAAIMKRLDDPDPLVRAVAVWHLGRWYERPEVRGGVLRKLHDESNFVKGWALNLIQTKRDAKALPEVRALLGDDAPEVRYDALHALAVLQGPQVLDTLKKTLREDESALVREGAVRCCTVIVPPTASAAEVLILGLRDKDVTVREAAIKLLRRGFGQSFEFDPSGEPLERDQGARRWQDWYETSKAGLHWSEERRRFEVAGAQPVPTR